MSKLSEQIHWWSCNDDRGHVDWCDLDDAILGELEYGSVPASEDGTWPDPDATIDVYGYVEDTMADRADLDEFEEGDTPIKIAVHGWVRASTWAKKFGLEFGLEEEETHG